MKNLYHSLWRGAVATLSFAIPLLFATFPSWETLTVGGALYTVLHFLQKKVGI